MISTPHRQTAVALIEEAVTAGARRSIACFELEVSERLRSFVCPHSFRKPKKYFDGRMN